MKILKAAGPSCLFAVFAYGQPSLASSAEGSDSWLKKLHLSFGFSGSYLSVRTVDEQHLRYGGLAFNTSAFYRWASMAIGVKSIASIGIERLNDNVVLNTDGASLDRGIQFVSFTPFYQYFIRSFEPFGGVPYFRLGTASSLTSLAFDGVPLPDGDSVRTKTTIRGRGVNLSLGLSFFDNEGAKNYFLEFDYQNVAPGEQQLININDFSEVVTVREKSSDDFERVHVVSISLGRNLF